MENLQVGVVFRGGDTTTECSDVHIRMIHLRQANKRETDLLAFRQLQSEDLFTDMTLVLKVTFGSDLKNINVQCIYHPIILFHYLSLFPVSLYNSTIAQPKKAFRHCISYL